ncbi:MAG: TIGR02281 family clan AA aspartic protease [Devosia sp.]|uniref:retropepsin-like aspartic protease family protein n=1 Tax=Devosia sp. TaxID=1871048 RepID=UPI001A3744EE|nr:TIGR02281 family clan AA aspartic protease [Devosia sp.]MBL8599415.1 TIGR02281 family clan AA aspartic protease [Devosia sp.]
MLFVGVALLVAVGLALLVSADAGSWLGLTQMQFGQLIPLVILAIIFAAGAFSRRQKFSTIIANFGVWAGLFVVVLIGYTYRENLKDLAARVVGELSPTTAIVDSENGTATFRRGLDGHFTVASTVNGARIPLLFDTGASAVVLSYRDAAQAGIDVGGLSFTLPVMTANGTGRAALVKLDRVEVGGIARRDVRAFVAEDGALQGSLLGMTFLETLSRYSVAGDKLELAD